MRPFRGASASADLATVLTPATSVGGGGGTISAEYPANNVTLTASGTITVTWPTGYDASTIVRIIQGGSGGYTPTFSGVTWLCSQPDWAAMAASDFVEVRIFSVNEGATKYAEWAFTSEFQILGSGVGTFRGNNTAELILWSVPARFVVGDLLDIVTTGRLTYETAVVGTPTCTLRWRLGTTGLDGTVLDSLVLTPTTGGANPKNFRIVQEGLVVSATALTLGGHFSGTNGASGTWQGRNAGIGVASDQVEAIEVTGVSDMTVAGKVLSLTAQWSTADAATGAKAVAYRVTRMRP
jgi:hypothetical protein